MAKAEDLAEILMFIGLVPKEHRDMALEKAKIIIRLYDDRIGSDNDQQACESCENVFDIEQMTMAGDVWICPECMAEWRKEFEACDHAWQPHSDGKVCRKCSCFVPESGNEHPVKPDRAHLEV